MSDPNQSLGDPVEEPNSSDDDVVSSAQAGLAEAARQNDDRGAELSAAASDANGGPSVIPPTAPGLDASTASAEDAYSVDERFSMYEASAADDASDSSRSETGAADASSHDAPTSVVASGDAEAETRVLHSEADADTRVSPPLTQTSAYSAEEPPAPTARTTSEISAHPIFVQAPESPRPRGNRGAAGAIGLIAAVAFAVLYLAVWLVLGLFEGTVTFESIGLDALGAISTPAMWTPVVIFFLAFWILGAMINRGRWGVWVILGILVGAASWGGHLLGQLVAAPFWEVTATKGSELVVSEMLVPMAIAAFIIGRELSIWFGAWVAARGRRVSELNREAQREYERALDSGPRL